MVEEPVGRKLLIYRRADRYATEYIGNYWKINWFMIVKLTKDVEIYTGRRMV